MLPSQDSGLGPLSFSLDFVDTFDTCDPQAPLEGVEVNLEVPVTINWNLHRTDLNDPAVSFGCGIWTKAGPGPHDLFADQVGLPNRKKVGTIEWSLTTKSERWVQKDAGRFRQVVTVTPLLLLTTRLLATNTPQIGIRQSRPTPCYGAWQNLT
ncbi:MAG: hypothetical protein QM790_17665 [Nibricoccus sp.]